MTNLEKKLLAHSSICQNITDKQKYEIIDLIYKPGDSGYEKQSKD